MPMTNQSRSGTAATNSVPPASSGNCAPSANCSCDIPGFCRSYFYTGKLLTEGDLTREQRYMIDKMRLHYVALHGWGVACGLMVRPHPQCPDRFVVTPGLAVDECGREVRLVKECITMFPKPPAPPPDPCAPDADRCEDGDDGPPADDRCQTYYVCIRYNECCEDFMPVVFGDCCGAADQPNRVCECATVELLTEPPECLRHTRHRKCHRCGRCECECRCERKEDCRERCEQIPEHCPPTGKACCILLAVIQDYRYYQPLTESMIDNSIRRVMPTVPRLEEMVRCLLEEFPRSTPRLTHISRFQWEHDRVYLREEFLHHFVGTPESPRGFEIEFDGRVLSKGLNNRTFQAMIVHEPRERHEPCRMEIAPARLARSEDGCRCTLHIHPEYAWQHLRERNFDVFLTLRCDKVIDERGLAVDGNLLAELREDEGLDYRLRNPSGDGRPGGTFESWIRVRGER
jgi:hypothetical protein